MAGPIRSLSAVTLATPDMATAVAFYRALGFETVYGGPSSAFTSLRAGDGFVNLQADPDAVVGAWGRAIVWVDDVDAAWDRCRAAGYPTLTEPADAPWGERYFHVRDPSGHELSLARPLAIP